MTRLACSHCRWWHKLALHGPRIEYAGGVETRFDAGECRCEAPVTDFHWPKTYADQWCGAGEPGYQEGGR
jgi:hypothetical protein